MNFDTLFAVWTFCDQKTRRKFILAHKPFYLKGKDYLYKTRTIKYKETRSWLADKIAKEHEMLRKTIDTHKDFFKYQEKLFCLLKNPKNWVYWGLTQKGFLQALYLEKSLGKNMYYEYLKTLNGITSDYKSPRFIGSQILFDTFKALPFHYFEKALSLLEGKIFNNIRIGSKRYETTKKITPEMKNWLKNLETVQFPILQGIQVLNFEDNIVYNFPGSVCGGKWLQSMGWVWPENDNET